MPFFRRDPEKTLERNHEKMVKQLAEKGSILAASLANELAAARGPQADRSLSTGRQDHYTQVGSRFVADEAEDLERVRPPGRDRRSADPDQSGFWSQGVHAARHPDAGGQIPYQRWPEHTVIHVEQSQYQERPFYQPKVDLRGQGRSGCTCGQC